MQETYVLSGIQPPPNCFAADLQHEQLYSRCAERHVADAVTIGALFAVPWPVCLSGTLGHAVSHHCECPCLQDTAHRGLDSSALTYTICYATPCSNRRSVLSGLISVLPASILSFR